MAMASREMLIFLYPIILLHLANITRAQVPNFLRQACTYSANYTTNGTYQSNLETVLSSLPSNTSNNYGFYSTSAGQDPDTVNAIALCRGDLSRETCSSCVSNATLKLREVCPNQMVAIGWYDICMLRYSNANIFHRVERDPSFQHWNHNNVTSPREFNLALRNLTDRLRPKAATGGSLRKFATGYVSGPDFLNIDGLMQCTPDLSEEDCSNCLYESVRQIPICCDGKEGAQFFRPSCYIRYEIYRFYGAIPAISLPQPPLSAPPSVSPPQLSTPSPPPPDTDGRAGTQGDVNRRLPRVSQLPSLPICEEYFFSKYDATLTYKINHELAVLYIRLTVCLLLILSVYLSFSFLEI